jgi:hypothetical protein
VIETQSPAGEITVGFSPFAAANALKAAVVSDDGWINDLTYKVVDKSK